MKKIKQKLIDAILAVVGFSENHPVIWLLILLVITILIGKLLM